MISTLASLVFQYRTPDRIKPRWLRQGQREPADRRGYTVSRRQWRTGWAVASGALSVAFVLDAPPPVFAGLGSGMVLLAAARPRS